MLLAFFFCKNICRHTDNHLLFARRKCQLFIEKRAFGTRFALLTLRCIMPRNYLLNIINYNIMPTKTNTRKTAAAASRTPEAESALKELFLDEIKDIYWAEQHLAKALPKMIKGATSEELKQTITNHLEETKNHVTRLESAFEAIGEKPKAVKCLAMEGLLKEADELLSDTDKGTEVRDVAIISAAQKVEHYEIASYGTLKTLAGTLGYADAQSLFEQTLAEEKNADSLLTQVAENYVNEAAAAEVE